MATGPYSWSTTAADNDDADTNINFAEGQTPASLNNSNRAMMAALAGWIDSIGGAATYGGSSSDYTITNPSVAAWASYAAGQLIALKANHTNDDTTVQLNVDGLGNQRIKTNDGGDPAIGDIVSGGIYLLAYDGTNFQILNTIAGGSYQPLDATLTALAALSWSSGNALVQFTAADTVSLTLTPSVTSITTSGSVIIAAGSAGTATGGIYVSTDTNTGIYSPSADRLAIFTGGTERFSVGNGSLTCTLASFFGDGTVSAPGIGFNSDTDNGWYRIGTNNWAGAVGGSKFIDISSTIIDFSVPVRGRTPASTETTGTLTAASSNKTIQATGGITIDGNVHTAGDFIFIYAGSASRTITQGSTGTPTQRLHGTSTTGNLTLAARGCACVFFISATEWVVSGDVS